MPKFIAVHTAPFTEEMFKNMAGNKLPEGLKWNHTYCDFESNKFFCEWDAPDKGHLEKYFNEGGMPFDTVHPVSLFNVEEADFE